jgi:hypothetical protein
MKPIGKHPIFAVSIVCIILLLSGNNLFSYIYCNGSGSGYECPACIGGESTAAIESMIIESAGYYLQGNSNIQTLLNRVELQDINGIDYPGIQESIKKALENITNARLTYEKLVKKAETTPYKEVVIEQLKSFDYKAFMLENRLNEKVFKQVGGYLSAGNITGTFKHVFSSIKKIEKLLISVQTVMDFSRIEPFWKINECCAELSLFGSYVARIFQSIQQK